MNRIIKVKLLISLSIIIILIYCVVDSLIVLYADYNLYNIAYERTYNESDIFEPPCIAICVNLLEILNTTLMTIKHPEIKHAAEMLVANDDRYFNWTVRQVIEDYVEGQAIILKRLSLSEMEDLMIPVDEWFTKCYFLDQSMNQTNCDYKNSRLYYYDHSVCVSFQFWTRLGINFNRSDIIIPGYQSLKLLYIKLDFSEIKQVNQVTITAHRLNKIPWSQGESTIEVPVEPNSLINHEFSFLEKTTRLLPPPYLSMCKIPNKPYTSVGHCLSRCFMTNFTKITGRVPHHYVINKANHLKFLEGQGLEQYRELVTQLYEPCHQVCGLVDCVTDTFEWRKVGKSSTYTRPGQKQVILQFCPPSTLPIIVRAKPQINWLNYFSSMGSVISLYFGLSTLSLIDWLINDNQLEIINFINKLLKSNNQVEPLNVEVLTFEKVDCKPKNYLTKVNSTLDGAIVNQYDTRLSSLK